jgi:hypothetical protein
MNMPNQPTNTLQSTAERMRLYRRRRRRGRRIVRVEIDAAEVEALVRRGYLEPKDREDRSAPGCSSSIRPPYSAHDGSPGLQNRLICLQNQRLF